MNNLRFTLILSIVSTALFTSCTTDTECGDGRIVDDFCAYAAPIVIEGGFSCPSALPMRFDFGDVTLCGPTGSTPDRAADVCTRGAYECAPAPIDGGSIDAGMIDAVADAGSQLGPCDAGPIDFCREAMPEGGESCCGAPVEALCRRDGPGFGCREGTIPTSECGACE